MQQQAFPEAVFFLFPLVFPVFWCVVCLLLSVVGGWKSLAESYGTDLSPRGTAFLWQSGAVGLVAYRNCLNIHATPDGLFLSVAWLFRVGHRPLFIPWRAIHNVEARQILWRSLTRFQVGTPAVGSVQIPSRIFQTTHTVA